MPTKFTSLQTVGTLAVGGILTVAGSIAGFTLSGNIDSNYVGALTNVPSIEIQPAAGSGGIISLKSGAGYSGTGAYLCIENPADGTMEVCAFSGGILDCNNFQHVLPFCP